jgi:hypothetical protein
MLLNGAAQIEETAMPCPQFALLYSVTCVQLRLITILGNCRCQFAWRALALRIYVYNSRRYLTACLSDYACMLIPFSRRNESVYSKWRTKERDERIRERMRGWAGE